MKLIHFCLTKNTCSYFQGEKNKAPTALRVLLLSSKTSAVLRDRNCVSCLQRIFISTQSKFLGIDSHVSVCSFVFDKISSCRNYPYHHLKMEIKAIQKQLHLFWNALFLSKISAGWDFLAICLIVCSYESQFYHCYLSLTSSRNQHRTHTASIPKLQKELCLSC